MGPRNGKQEAEAEMIRTRHPGGDLRFRSVRARLTIIADILTVTKKPSIQAHIIRKCTLSTLQWNELIPNLIAKGFITTRQVQKPKSTTVYLTTDKGKELLNRYKKLTAMTKGKKRKSKKFKEYYGRPYTPKTLVEVKRCKKCRREMPEHSTTRHCPYCGGMLQTTYRPVERVRESP